MKPSDSYVYRKIGCKIVRVSCISQSLVRVTRSRVATLLCTVGNLEMVGRLSFFAESYRLYVPELKSVGWQCANLGQLVGTTKIQDGCRDRGKLQNVFIFILHYVRNIICVCTRMLWRIGIRF